MNDSVSMESNWRFIQSDGCERASQHLIHNDRVDGCVLDMSVTCHVTRKTHRKISQQPILITYSTTYGRDMRRVRRSEGVIFLPGKRVTGIFDANKLEDREPHRRI